MSGRRWPGVALSPCRGDDRACRIGARLSEPIGHDDYGSPILGAEEGSGHGPGDVDHRLGDCGNCCRMHMGGAGVLARTRAGRKGHSFMGFFLLSLLFFPSRSSSRTWQTIELASSLPNDRDVVRETMSTP